MENEVKNKQQSYYDKYWVESSKQGKQSDIDWTYDKRRIDVTLLGLLNSLKDTSTKIQVLEIGAGEGTLASKLSSQRENDRISYLGIDMSEAGIRIARQKVDSRFQFLVADGISLPLESQQFDIVICSEVIEHVIEKEELLTEIGRVLGRQGQLLLTTSNPKSLSYILPRLLNNIRRFRHGSNQPVNELISREELVKQIERHNFEILSHTGLVFRPYTVGMLEGFAKRPVLLVRWFSEYL